MRLKLRSDVSERNHTVLWSFHSSILLLILLSLLFLLPACFFSLCSRTPFQLFSIWKLGHKSTLTCDTAAAQPPLTDTERRWRERELRWRARLKMKEWREREEEGKELFQNQRTKTYLFFQVTLTQWVCKGLFRLPTQSRLESVCFEPHLDVIWNQIQIRILKLCLSLNTLPTQIRFHNTTSERWDCRRLKPTWHHAACTPLVS